MLKNTISCCTVFGHAISPCDVIVITIQYSHQHNTHAIARVYYSKQAGPILTARVVFMKTFPCLREGCPILRQIQLALYRIIST